MSSEREQAAAFAPGGIGNIGPGLDVLGMAVTGLGDRVSVRRTESGGLVIANAGHPELPTDVARNTAGIAARAVVRLAATEEFNAELSIDKGLPLSGGQGGSAASAVAGAVAMNRVLGDPLDVAALLACALEAESTVSGRHADNLVPALLGGVVLIRSVDPVVDAISLPWPEELRVVMAHPAQRLETVMARAVLPRFIAREMVIRQMANVAAMVAAFASGDLALLGRALDDQIAEPVRAPLVPGFLDAKAAAIAAGALGGSISGAGPTSFFFAGDDVTAARVAAAVSSSYAHLGIACTSRVARIARTGALAS